MPDIEEIKAGAAGMALPPAVFAGGQYMPAERGHRTGWEAAARHAYAAPALDMRYAATVAAIRQMDATDPRVKRIHGRMARDVIRGGLLLQLSTDSERIARRWDAYRRRTGLDRPEKLKSDARNLVVDGELPLQWVVQDGHVAAAVRMPPETLRPLVQPNGRWRDVRAAYEQTDGLAGTAIARFALWQITCCRLDPASWDDAGARGRPYLDASRGHWQQLAMTETDLVIRRRERAPLRTAHTLEGASSSELEEYRAKVEEDQRQITRNYYMNKRGSVAPVQGDANLDQIADVVHLLDTFFSAAPGPKALFGYASDMNRDILDGIKRDYYEEVDEVQDTIAWAYRAGFELDLLLAGLNPGRAKFVVKFAERRTETANQAADRALKWQALGMPSDSIIELLGEDPKTIHDRLAAQRAATDPYPTTPPDPDDRPAPPPPRVAVTPGNAPLGESATTISTRR